MKFTARLFAAVSSAALALAACTVEAPDDGNTANPSAANATTDGVDSAMPDLDAPAPAPETPEAGSGGTAPDVEPTPAPSPDGVAPDGSAQAGATLVERYYALIGEGDYAAAWRLWDNGGRASGMSEAAFARSFDKFASYRAQVGAPGRIDAGAGQRYVTVPVTVRGRLKDGNRPFAMQGSVTLHRAGDIDGATVEQRSWRIHSADVKPRPGEATPEPSPSATVDNRSTARYRCSDGSRLTGLFDNDNRVVTMQRGDTTLAVLSQQRSGSGIRYSGGGYSLRGKGREITFTAPGKDPITCTATN